jgi:hypothetical protein
MIYILLTLLVLSLGFNYFGMKLIGQQSIALDKLKVELFSLKIQLDLEKARQSQEENETPILERIVQ